MKIGEWVSTLFLGGFLGALIGLASANHPAQFQPEQCSTMPTGRTNKAVFEVMADGKSIGMAERVTGTEWVTVCGKQEWR